MENQQYDEQNEEVVNPEQFQVGRAPEEEKSVTNEDAGYTQGETEYADGQGTRLGKELDVPDSEDLEEEYVEEDDIESDPDETDDKRIDETTTSFKDDQPV